MYKPRSAFTDIVFCHLLGFGKRNLRVVVVEPRHYTTVGISQLCRRVYKHYLLVILVLCTLDNRFDNTTIA